MATATSVPCRRSVRSRPLMVSSLDERRSTVPHARFICTRSGPRARVKVVEYALKQPYQAIDKFLDKSLASIIVTAGSTSTVTLVDISDFLGMFVGGFGVR